MKRRLLSLLLAFVMVLGLCSTAFAAEGVSNFKQVNTYTDGQFTDVPKGQWYAATVKRAYELGLMKGTGNGTTFTPNGNITIAETLALACRLHSTYYDNGAQFVQGSPWYKVYVDYAIANGIIAADEYESYTVKATRTDFAVILSRAMPIESFPILNTGFEIPDLLGFEPYAESVYWLYATGILTGSDSYGTFKPESNIMRSEVATIVVRMADPSQRKTFTLAAWPENTADNMQGVWRSAAGDIELVFNGDHFTYVRKDVYSNSTDYYFFQGVVGENMRQHISLWDYAEGEDNCFGYVSSDLLHLVNCGNVVWVDWYDCLYKATTPELTEEVRAAIGGENILPVESLKTSAITSIRMEAPYEVVDASGGEGYKWLDATTCYGTINGKEYEMTSSMLNWTTSDPSVAEMNISDAGWGGSVAVISNGTARLTAEYNGMQVSTDIIVTNCVPVNYISDRYVWDYNGYHVFAYSLKDKDYNRIARDCVVALRIVNDSGETVFEDTRYVWDTDFSQWTYQGEKMLLGSIYIYDEEILPGTTDTGTLYYQVSDFYDGDFYWFKEYSLDISDLPLKETTLELPELPQDINCYNYDKTIRHSCTITAASYEVEKNHMTVYLSGQKTYDEDGSWQSNSCYIGWKLYDAEGYVVDSGTCYTSSVSEGEKFRNAEINIYNLDIGGSYKLVLTHSN